MYENGKEPQIVYVERYVHGGYGIGKLPGGKLVLVEGGYPSELVKVSITEERNDMAFGKVVEILEPAKFRRTPRCKYFGTCGGCQLMDVEYETQLVLKREIVQDQLRRIAKLETEVNETIPSDLEFGYRNKMEFSFGFRDGRVLLGLKRRNSIEIVDVDECPISPTSFNKALAVVPEIVETTKVKIYNPVRRTGTLKHLVMRYSHSHNQTMAIFVTKTETFREARDIRALLLRKVPQINSIIHVMNSSDTVVLRGPYKTLYGSGVLEVEMDYEKFQIPPTAFFQNNHHVTNKMIEHVVKSLELEGKETILDLYAGVGTFTMRLAMLSKFVTAVENAHIAVKAGRANANINNLRNVKFEEADVEEFLKSYDGSTDVVVLDPPRTGAGKAVCKRILELKPKKIAYISCDPATLARDLAILKEHYKIKSVQPFDMFPQTYHVETVVVLERIM
ncbi:23S rRNA (uracil(1939)-C(5))-methyltransferase RlmD [Fervidobacterium thailandense]|uniref:23S rRNA (Uracil-5-)-methyltransferase RumA n=1 Tax=Fervidobacterium thailandense TaxID=1008305 RepID=A0A1E3G4K9_9BACT|nr:23S rRNA (uracil(1939)-C(5))-methyltransferase RlmD [Fervidobacterium thailandense]ODN31169.1 23S rRNA (uracil-5-)-methyltransferase RumA [Fervidobacterium thailandense]